MEGDIFQGTVHTNKCFFFTLAVRVEVEDTACSHHRLQGDDLVQRHSEELVLVEPPWWRMVRFMRTEVVVAEGKPLPPGSLQQWMVLLKLRLKRRSGGGGGTAHSLFFQTVNLLLILPEFLDPEDVQLVSVDVRQETVWLSEWRTLGCAPAVSHQINTIACAQNTHKRVAWCRVCPGGN